MIRDQIIYKNSVLLTIFHDGFENDKKTVRRNIPCHIGKNIARFTEEYVPASEWEQGAGYVCEEKALLHPGIPHNPYSGRTCAHMKHRIYLEKPAPVQKNGRTPIDGKHLTELLAFIRKYTGMNLENNPEYLGDIFLFSPFTVGYRSSPRDSVIVSGLKQGMHVLIRFKYGKGIVQTRLVEAGENTEQTEIECSCRWNSHDIEIYKDGLLLYANYDISYIKSMYLNLEIKERAHTIPLNTFEDHKLQRKGQTSSVSIGTVPEQSQILLAQLNRELIRKLQLQKPTDRFLFIRPGEQENAKNRIARLIDAQSDEIWLIDSYFTDRSLGLFKMLDWLRLLVCTPAGRINIIFYSKNSERALNISELKEYMKHDTFILNCITKNPRTKMSFIQTDAPVHDRFVITRTSEEYAGLSIGTSFNSLDSNHYCIQTLSHTEAEEVIISLSDWIRDHTEASEEL